MFERPGCQLGKQNQNCANHVMFCYIYSPKGWARRSAWSEKCVKHAMFERLGCPMAGRTQNIAKHICFVPLWAAMGRARRNAWSVLSLQYLHERKWRLPSSLRRPYWSSACRPELLRIGCSGDLGAKWRSEAELQNIYVLFHFGRRWGGPGGALGARNV